MGIVVITPLSACSGFRNKEEEKVVGDVRSREFPITNQPTNQVSQTQPLSRTMLRHAYLVFPGILEEKKVTVGPCDRVCVCVRVCERPGLGTCSFVSACRTGTGTSR